MFWNKNLFLLQLSTPVAELCWPLNEVRYTKSAEEMIVGDSVHILGYSKVKIPLSR